MSFDYFRKLGSSRFSSPLKDSKLDLEPFSQNLVSTRYKVWLGGMIREACITWFSGILGNGFLVRVSSKDEQAVCRCKVDISHLLFWKKQRRRTFMVDNVPVDVIWDCASAKYSSGPEPYADYYVALVCDGEIALAVGDMGTDITRRLKFPESSFSPVALAKREHVFGKKVCESRATFSPEGREHLISVECWKPRGCRVPGLRIRIDGVLYLEVKHLTWQFRGNKTIIVDGVAIDVFWDAHNWLFDGMNGYAVFMFEASKANWSESYSEFGEEESDKCFFPLPSWSSMDQNGSGHAKDWLKSDSISLTSSDDSYPCCSPASFSSSSNNFSLTLISWRHDLKSRKSK